MPELPEAEVVAAQLRSRLLGARLKDCWVGRPDIVRQGLETLDWYRGTQLTAINRKGKSVVLAWSREEETRYMVIELGMTGLLLFRSPDASYLKHTHLILHLEGGQEAEIRYWNPRRFGRIHLLTASGLDGFLAKRFGHDPLALSWETFQQIVRTRRGRVKALLMHQQVLAGIGNIYANEILFRARLHPYRGANQLGPAAIRRLYDSMRDVLIEAIRQGGSSIRDFIAPDGSKGRYRAYHQVYDKEGERCPSGCGRRIRRLVGERSSFFCPACQRK